MVELLDRAHELGVFHEGWRFLDYCLEAVPTQRWICAVIWGEKGSYKSNLLLQHGYAMFHGYDSFHARNGINVGEIKDWKDVEAWRSVLDCIVFRSNDFAKLLKKTMTEGKRLSWVGWDDINIYQPRSMYSTNRRQWEEFAKNWEGMRANLSVFECTAPSKENVVSYIQRDMNFDILASGRHISEVRRWMLDWDFYEPSKVMRCSIKIEDVKIERDNVPREVWQEYWDRKIKLIDESTEKFAAMLFDIDKPPSQQATTRSPKECPWCHKVMNEWNLRTHEPNCKQKPALSPSVA